jgi:hypothetical protein
MTQGETHARSYVIRVPQPSSEYPPLLTQICLPAFFRGMSHNRHAGFRVVTCFRDCTCKTGTSVRYLGCRFVMSVPLTTAPLSCILDQLRRCHESYSPVPWNCLMQFSLCAPRHFISCAFAESYCLTDDCSNAVNEHGSSGYISTSS